MASHASPQIAPEQWTQITSGTVAGRVRIQNVGGNEVYVQATTGSAPPSTQAAQDGAVWLGQRDGARISLADDFPGVPGATALFAWAPNRPSRLSVSHA